MKSTNFSVGKFMFFLLSGWTTLGTERVSWPGWQGGWLSPSNQIWPQVVCLNSLSSQLNSLKLPEFVKDFVRTTFQTSSTFPWNFVTMQLLGTGYWSHKIYWIQHAHTKGKNFQIFYCRRYVGSMVEGKMEGKGGLTFKKFLIDLSFQVNMTHISNSSNISKGEMTWPSGDQYIGDWVNNQRLIVKKIYIFGN